MSRAARDLYRDGGMDLYRTIALQAPVHMARPLSGTAGSTGFLVVVSPGSRTAVALNLFGGRASYMAKLFAVKPLSSLKEEAVEEGEHTLKRSLGPVNLITLGIGAIIGAGIFVLTGQAAALHAGPAVALSFVVAGITCAFAGLCYAEFASIIPIAGSAYTYGYATLGELVAWIIGWDLTLEYAFGASTVASGWAAYFNSLLQQFHIYIPPQLTATTGTPLVFYHDQWLQLMSLPPGVSAE